MVGGRAVGRGAVRYPFLLAGEGQPARDKGQAPEGCAEAEDDVVERGAEVLLKSTDPIAERGRRERDRVRGRLKTHMFTQREKALKADEVRE